ncbi:MAG: ABC transporter ATP-binding protein [Candidatus Hodarchaeota archaeon]
MSETIVVETENLTKYYGKSRGIENLSLEVYQGEIFGLLGPNGAGKTTTIRVLLDLIRRTSGEARIFGMDVVQHSTEIRQRSAYIPGELGLYEEKTARRNIRFLLGMYNNSISERKVEELADRLGLDLDRKVKELSKGNKQKVAIILALAPEVELLILDEPTSGVDPLIKIDFYKMLGEIQKETDTTVLLSSHLLGEVERVARRVGVIREGTIVEAASIEQLKKMALKEVTVYFSNETELKKFTSKIPKEIVKTIEQRPNESRASFTVGREDLSRILSLLSQISIDDLDVSSPALEDIFLRYYESTPARIDLLKNTKIRNEEVA